MPTARRFGADFGLQQPESGGDFRAGKTPTMQTRADDSVSEVESREKRLLPALEGFSVLYACVSHRG